MVASPSSTTAIAAFVNNEELKLPLVTRKCIEQIEALVFKHIQESKPTTTWRLGNKNITHVKEWLGIKACQIARQQLFFSASVL